uniref:Uncharacterized protein LOC116957454 n=1 Tax=Petromyzon marinus TaxID=7757 RepID=A0AAJ7UIR4_PETMA|nr:uncharacterized protein LOC116957454 [Petromyzon marinus]XP_032835488.1 uncharacterized protein LOC116957454 [Petromyzon marinus]
MMLLSAITFTVITGGWRLHVSPNATSWRRARDYCREVGAELAVIPGPVVNSRLASALSETDGKFWIGLRKAGGLQWRWIDNSSADGFLNWAPSEPNNLAREDCVEMYVVREGAGHVPGDDHVTREGAGHVPGDDHVTVRHARHGRWNDEHCGKRKRALCVIGPADPTAAPTTANPTTANPTTADPTTADPITAEETTTADPTTAKKPTTADPTIADPITAEETTTADPTTAKKPTTADPTKAKELTTADPIIAEEPTTADPTTAKKPTTADPITADPITAEEPTTADPTTADPITAEEPTTADPTTADSTVSMAERRRARDRAAALGAAGVLASLGAAALALWRRRKGACDLERRRASDRPHNETFTERGEWRSSPQEPGDLV